MTEITVEKSSLLAPMQFGASALRPTPKPPEPKMDWSVNEFIQKIGLSSMKQPCKRHKKQRISESEAD